MQVNQYKMIVAVLGMTFGTIIVILSLVGGIADDRFALSMTLGSNLITGPLFYIVGNGVAARGGIDPDPILRKTKVKDN